MRSFREMYDPNNKVSLKFQIFLSFLFRFILKLESVIKQIYIEVDWS
jgi:hypothetical protein